MLKGKKFDAFTLIIHITQFLYHHEEIQDI